MRLGVKCECYLFDDPCEAQEFAFRHDGKMLAMECPADDAPYYLVLLDGGNPPVD